MICNRLRSVSSLFHVGENELFQLCLEFLYELFQFFLNFSDLVCARFSFDHAVFWRLLVLGIEREGKEEISSGAD
jgi:hypothetical protein